METINQLESELKDLQKKRGEVEYRLRTLETKEKSQLGLGKRPRGDQQNQNQHNKRPRDYLNNERRDNGTFRSANSSDRNNEREREDNSNPKTSRLSSVVTGNAPRSRDSREFKSYPRDSRESRDSRADRRDDTKRPKLGSAIVTQSPIPVVGEKPRPSLDVNNSETKNRSKKLFGVLVNHLQSFKNDISKKTEADIRREELESKIQQKVKEEQEALKEQQQKAIQEQKAKELALREEIKSMQEQKEMQLLNMKWDGHFDNLTNFFKTEAKPCIFYRPAPGKWDQEELNKERERQIEERKKFKKEQQEKEEKERAERAQKEQNGEVEKEEYEGHDETAEQANTNDNEGEKNEEDKADEEK